MKNTVLGIIVALLPMLQGCTPKQAPAERIIACGDDKVLIIDCSAVETDSANIVWSWEKAMVKDVLPDDYQHYLRVLDDCKPVDGGKKILLTASSSAVLLLDVETKQPLFWAHVPMAHSAEMLPGDRVVVALSTHDAGNSIELYDQARPEECIYRDNLYSGHGVVWMEKEQLLYALGYDELRAYRLADWDTSQPRLEQVKQWALPSKGGHDLVKIAEEQLVVTSHENVHVFSTATGTFEVFAPLAERQHVKSVNYNPITEELIYTIAEESWWTHHIYGSQWPCALTIDWIDLYKVRVMH